jgi:hypothetical protein
VWDAERGTLVVELTHDQPVRRAAFGADGKVVTVIEDGTEWEWTLDPASVLRALWLSTPYCLGFEERSRLLGEDDARARAGEAACKTMTECVHDPHRTYEDCLAGFRAEQAKH